MSYAAETWNTILAPERSWREVYPAVANIVRATLVDLSPDPYLGTKALVEKLYPEAEARGREGLDARYRLFKALASLATRDLADCATRGSPMVMRRYKTTVRPWYWHAPTTPNVEAVIRPTCPHCGGSL